MDALLGAAALRDIGYHFPDTDPQYKGADSLELLRILSVKGGVGAIVEWGGPGIETLSVPERGTITNMGTELGATTSIFPSDEITHQFLIAQSRGEVYVPLESDPDAEYDRVRQCMKNDRVWVYEIEYKNDVPWGKLEDGWICLKYARKSD